MRHLNYYNLLLFTLLLLNIFLLSKLDFFIPYFSGNHSLLDFDAYYYLSLAVRKGINPYLVSTMTTLGPPFVILPFVPFSYLDIVDARVLFSVTSIICGFLSVYLLNKKFFKGSLATFLIFFGVLFSSFPARFTLGQGQPNLIIMFFITLLIISKSNSVKSLLLVFLYFFKTFFLYMAVILFRGCKSMVIVSLVVATIIGTISLFIIKPEWLVYYFTNLNSSFLQSNIVVGLDYYNQSIYATLARLDLINLWLILLALIVFTFYMMIKGNLLSAVIASIIISPVAWQHYFVILFPIFIIVLKKTNLFNFKYLLLFLLSLFFWWAEFPILHFADKNLATSLLASHYFLSAVILLTINQSSKLSVGICLRKNKDS